MASRFLAFLIDVTVLFVMLFAVSTVVSMGVSASTAASGSDDVNVVVAVLATVATFALLLFWFPAWEIATKGRSLGKMALGLRVVTVDGAPIRIRHALIRGLVGVVEILLAFGCIAAAVALLSKRFRRLGDHLAGTVVVRERGAGADRAHPRRFVPYPGWEAWAARLDATRLTADDYRLVRSFLLRSARLPPDARARLGHQILDRVLPRAGIDPATAGSLVGGGVEPPLVAVAAAYQRRFDGVTL